MDDTFRSMHHHLFQQVNATLTEKLLKSPYGKIPDRHLQNGFRSMGVFIGIRLLHFI